MAALPGRTRWRGAAVLAVDGQPSSPTPASACSAHASLTPSAPLLCMRHASLHFGATSLFSAAEALRARSVSSAGPRLPRLPLVLYTAISVASISMATLSLELNRRAAPPVPLLHSRTRSCVAPLGSRPLPPLPPSPGREGASPARHRSELLPLTPPRSVGVYQTSKIAIVALTCILDALSGRKFTARSAVAQARAHTPAAVPSLPPLLRPTRARSCTPSPLSWSSCWACP